MPRPQRTRVASKRAAAPIAKELSPVPAPAPQQVTDSNDIYDVSDRETNRRQTRRVSQRTSSARTASTSNAQQAAALDAARVKRDAAMQRLGNITSTSVTGDTNTAEDDTESSIEVEMGRRAVAATPSHGARLHDVSGLELDDSLLFDDLNTTLDTAGPNSAQRSMDNSTLTASNLKRRPRAGSFLSRDDGPLRPSSRAGPNTPGFSSTFNIGVFKRRAREPSILGTTQKPRAERPVAQDNGSDKSDEEEEDDEEAEEEPVAGNQFSPEAESTPLRRSKRRSGVADPAPDNVEEASSVNTRKRKSTDAHEQRARSSPFPEDQEVHDAPEESDDGPLSSPPSLPQMPRRASTPLIDENISPPESSDSENEADVWPPLQSLAKGRTRRPPSALRNKTPVRETAPDLESDISSPPSLTYSPNYADPSPPPQRAARQTKAATKPVTTADLTGLLPRRRHRARNDAFGGDDSDDEVDAAGLGNDEDELSYLDVRPRRRAAARPLSRTETANQGANRAKGKTPAKPARTYGRSADKENEQEEDDDTGDSELEARGGGAAGDDASENSQELVARVGEELKNASRKFAEVDKWELAFEETTQSSSPRDAR